MAPFVVRRIVHTPAERVWGVLADFASHGRWAPMTRVRTDPGPPRAGWSFTATTGCGPGMLRDRMTVDLWEPPDRTQPGRPARYRVTKHGPILRGWANVQVTSLGGVIGPSTSEVVWTEDLWLGVPLVGRIMSPLLHPLGRLTYGVVIDRMLAAAARQRA